MGIRSRYEYSRWHRDWKREIARGDTGTEERAEYEAELAKPDRIREIIEESAETAHATRPPTNRARQVTLLLLALLIVAFVATWISIPSSRRDAVQPPVKSD